MSAASGFSAVAPRPLRASVSSVITLSPFNAPSPPPDTRAIAMVGAK